MTTINEDIARAQLLLGNFEKKCSCLSGLSDLSEALQIISDIRDFSSDASIKSRADNLILSYSKFAKSKINAILQNPNEHKPETLVYWERIADSFIPFGDDEFVSMRDVLTKHKETAQLEALFLSKREIIALIKALPLDKRNALIDELKRNSNAKAD